VLQPLGKAHDRADESVGLCADDDVKHARARLKQVRKQLMQFAHRLRSNAARRKAPAEVREPLAGAADGIASDLKTLRTTLACPGDAANVP
jgi:hypothetical protein